MNSIHIYLYCHDESTRGCSGGGGADIMFFEDQTLSRERDLFRRPELSTRFTFVRLSRVRSHSCDASRKGFGANKEWHYLAIVDASVYYDSDECV